MVDPFENRARQGGSDAIREVSHFFNGMDSVFESLDEIATRLTKLGVPYAVLGGMALVAHGYRRTTEDIDILITGEGLKRIHDSLLGLGYRPLFEGSKNVRDARTGVRIEFVLAGEYPGDGKPKPVAFPNPADVAVEIDGIRYVQLATLIELKLASGMTNPGRLRDLADVQELIRQLSLPPVFAGQLNPFVRGKFDDLAAGIRGLDEPPQV